MKIMGFNFEKNIEKVEKEAVTETFDPSSSRSNKKSKEIKTFDDLGGDLPQNQEKNETEEKKVKLEQIKKEVESSGDTLGKGIDEKIKEAVIMCKALGMPTSSSCEGHVDKNGLRVPYVEITAENKPERWEGVNSDLEKIRSLKESDNEKYHEEYWKIMREYNDKEETPEYKKWNEENKKLKEKAEIIVREFYKDRKAEPNAKLQIDEMVDGLRIYSGGEDYKPVIEVDGEKQFSIQEKITFYKKLEKYQGEMREFAKFLKDRFLGKDANY